MRAFRIAGVILILMLGVAVTASADLLGLSADGKFPILTFNPGTTTFDAQTGVFSLQATPLAVLFSPTELRLISPFAPRSVTLRVHLDAAGHVVGAAGGDRLVVVGDVLGMPGLSGTLLVGEIVAFGHKDFDTSTDLFDVRLRLTGGALGPSYDGRDIGVTLTSQASSFTGVFTASFAGEGNGDVFPAPVVDANAGPDQTVHETDVVQLDGTASIGADRRYSWEQLAGPLVFIEGPTSATPWFTTPALAGGFGSQTLTFELKVTSEGGTDRDSVDVIVQNVNHAPVAVASGPTHVNELSPVTLSGTNSYDPDGDPITYHWEQTGGPTVALDGIDAPHASFVAPELSGGTTGTDLTFALTVSDGAAMHSTLVTVQVENVNHPPVADAGTARTVNVGTLVTLDGSASADPDRDALSYAWTQAAGPAVAVTGADTVAPTFVAPGAPATLTFRLVVRDAYDAVSEPADVTITIRHPNDPPRCDLAIASPPRLWPPNHKMVHVKILGVTDPNHDGVVVTVTGVWQDEPVNWLGDGDTSPDAVIQGSGVLLRSERSGLLNGRVYHVGFTAWDVRGAECTGSATVGVPHDLGRQKLAIDDGPLYDSTGH